MEYRSWVKVRDHHHYTGKYRGTVHERFDEDKLPKKEAFFSDLSKEHISQEEFEFLNKLWKEFGMISTSRQMSTCWLMCLKISPLKTTS